MTVPGLRYLPVKPQEWPQDKATVPGGFGGMPRVDFDNRHNIRQEAFAYGVTSMSVAAGAIGTAIIPIESDGDFWCDQIVFIADAGGTVATKIFIRDTRTGYALTYPHARFQDFEIQSDLTIDALIPRLTASLPKPYCFTRNGGIEVTVDNSAPGTAINVIYNFAFLGWKEFEYVSR